MKKIINNKIDMIPIKNNSIENNNNNSNYKNKELSLSNYFLEMDNIIKILDNKTLYDFDLEIFLLKLLEIDDKIDFYCENYILKKLEILNKIFVILKICKNYETKKIKMLLNKFLNFNNIIDTCLLNSLIEFTFNIMDYLILNKNDYYIKLFTNNLLIYGYNSTNEVDYYTYKHYIMIFYQFIDNLFNLSEDNIQYGLNLYYREFISVEIEEILILIVIKLDINYYLSINQEELFKNIFSKIIKFNSNNLFIFYLNYYLFKFNNLEENKFIINIDYLNYIKNIIIQIDDHEATKEFIKIIVNLYYENIYILDKELVIFLINNYLREFQQNNSIWLKIGILNLFNLFFNKICNWNIYDNINKFLDIIWIEYENINNDVFYIELLNFLDAILLFEIENNIVLLEKHKLFNLVRTIKPYIIQNYNDSNIYNYYN